jgi:D-serine dehydratase
MDTATIGETLLDGRTKGIPAGTPPFRLDTIATKGWNVLAEDLPLPLMLLRRSKLDHNARVFGAYLLENELSFAPHGKTTMAPQIFAEQLAAGAWGLTAATVQQAAVMAHHGATRILIANQIVGRSNVAGAAALLAAHPEMELYCYTDSVEQLDRLAAHLAAAPPPRPLRLLLEVGVEGGRTGVRGREEARALATAIAGTDRALLRFAGVAAFEGVVPGIRASSEPVAAFAQKVVEVAADLPAPLLDGLDEFVLTGGGSSHFDLVADRFKTLALPVPVRIVLRSGCYVTNDSGSYFAAQEAARLDPARSWKSRLEPAMEAWAYVQSRPEPGLALLTMGKRDAPYDAGLPVLIARHRPGTGPLAVGEAEIFAMNDQHAFARIAANSDWQVGDMVGCGISHPCTAFDKWRFLPVVDDGYTVIDGMLTYF